MYCCLISPSCHSECPQPMRMDAKKGKTTVLCVKNQGGAAKESGGKWGLQCAGMQHAVCRSAACPVCLSAACGYAARQKKHAGMHHKRMQHAGTQHEGEREENGRRESGHAQKEQVLRQTSGIMKRNGA
eukprot:scaffold204230_cov18-Tisochrysis_lutea.AAC.1